MKVFLDTNILVAALLRTHEHHSRALPLVQSIHDQKHAGHTSAHAVLEVYSILTRLPGSPRVSSLQASSLIDENITRHFTVVSLSSREYLELVVKLGKEGVLGGQSYDALHLACAQKCGAERVYTLNVQHFERLAGSALRGRILSP